MMTNVTILLIVVTLSAVTAQTFQYSRGWTNGKRDGHRSYPGRTEEYNKEISSSLEKILTPCQMAKLKYLLEGKPLNERLFTPCDYMEEEDQPKRYKNDHNSDLFDAFQ